MDKSGHGLNKRKNLIGGILGQLTYIVLYIGKTFLSLNLLFGVPKEGAWATLATKLGSSVINAVFAVLISMALMLVINSRPEVRRQVDQIN